MTGMSSIESLLTIRNLKFKTISDKFVTSFDPCLKLSIKFLPFSFLFFFIKIIWVLPFYTNIFSSSQELAIELNIQTFFLSHQNWLKQGKMKNSNKLSFARLKESMFHIWEEDIKYLVLLRNKPKSIWMALKLAFSFFIIDYRSWT